jgi:hypothetical protein
MSFYTGINFTRPLRPPQITGSNLADFFARLFALNLIKPTHQIGIQLRFGDRIDADDKPINYLEPTSDLISSVRTIKLDVDESDQSPDQMLSLLRKCSQPIYRAFISLGSATNAFYRYMEVPEFANSDPDSLALDSWSFSIAPISSRSLSSDQDFNVGWIALTLSGYGHIYPWPWPQLAAHIASHPDIARAMDLCRSTWPVPSLAPDRAAIKQRQAMGDLWPFPNELKRPWDWFWTLAETG